MKQQWLRKVSLSTEVAIRITGTSGACNELGEMCLNKIELVRQRSVVRKVALAMSNLVMRFVEVVPGQCHQLVGSFDLCPIETLPSTGKMLIQNQLEILLEVDRRRWPSL